MSTTLESAKISELIQSATQKIVSQTEEFIQSVKGKPVGMDTISMMINGEKILLNQDDYLLLKAQNDAIKQKMKEEIKALMNSIKQT